MKEDDQDGYVITWRYTDGSASGVLPILYPDAAKVGEVLELLRMHCDGLKEFLAVGLKEAR